MHSGIRNIPRPPAELTRRAGRAPVVLARGAAARVIIAAEAMYTSLEAVVLPIGPNPRHVQALRRPAKSDLLLLGGDRAVAAPRLPGSNEHRRGPPRPR
jgi:hypothetical protein